MKAILRKMKVSQLKSNKGFSLVELLCAIALLALIATPIIQIFYTGLNLNLKSRKMLGAADLTSGVSEYVSSLVFNDFGVKKAQDAYGNEYVVSVVARGYSYFYWGNDSDPRKLDYTTTTIYNNGPTFESYVIEGDNGTPANDTERTIKFYNVEMDGFKYDVWIKTTKPSGTGYSCNDAYIYVMLPGNDDSDYLSYAKVAIPNCY